MKFLSLSLWFSYLLVNLAINETYGHPKSWLTTTERPKPLRAKPKRSVSKVDVTYYPGLTGEYKDALRFEELRKFLQEEEEEAEGEEEVIIRLLQEEHESRTEEPIEFAVQKRVMMQLRNPQLKETIDIIEFPDESFVYETLRDSTHGNNDYLESTKYSIEEDGKPQKHGTTSKSGYDLRIDSVPDAMVKRLLSGESATSEKHHDASQFHQQYINTSGNHPLRHDVDVHLRHRQNFDHDTRQDVLLERLLKRQHQINSDDLEFLTASNNGEIETNSNHTTSGEVEPDGDDVISEAQLDWEEYHEYDA